MSFPRALYTSAVRLATPAALIHLARRTSRQTHDRDDWRARLGWVPRDTRAPVWIHAASAGEMQSAAPLAAALAREYPVRLSAFTATGRAVAGRFVPEIPCDFAPLDLPGAWRRYLGRVDPRLAVVIETELWPNLIAVAAARNVPLVLASARLTPGAARRLARAPRTVREMLGSVTRILAQSEADLERFAGLGFPRERGVVAGSLKEALLVPPGTVERGQALRAGPLAGRRVWVAGSVRPGEETAIAEAAAAVREAVSDAVALVVPRHPETASVFREALAARGVKVAAAAELLDALRPLPGGGAVVVDRVGVLLALYGAAEVAFVGGTLTPVGGHNVLEPALLGLPVVVGPSLANVRAAADRLKAVGGLSVVCDGLALGREVAALLTDRAAREAAGAAGREVAGNPAALNVTLSELRGLLR